ncbi:hypothetical protein NEOC95_002325 [Neochlamydia sp. AcF95]|nr:hypothetical protein [Neochlamydia sp. AcF95]
MCFFFKNLYGGQFSIFIILVKFFSCVVTIFSSCILLVFYSPAFLKHKHTFTRLTFPRRKVIPFKETMSM